MTRRQLLSLTAAVPAFAADKEPAIHALFAPLVAGGRAAGGFAVLVRHNGRTVFERGYGEAIDAQTNFRLASFTKQFTAAAIMLLVRAGKLRYDTTLTGVFPDFAAYGQAVTIRHLLTHTSGIPDYESVMETQNPGRWLSSYQIRDSDVLDLLKAQQKVRFAPGASWAYSNSGYVLLGCVAAKVAGEAFPRVLDNLIFTPLAMHDTVAFVDGVNSVSHRAYGHPGDQSATSATLGDGGIYSNLRDLAKWDDALATHRLLSAAEMAPALTPVRLADGSATKWPTEKDDDNLHPGKPVAYGYGWFLDPYKGRKRMWHTGSTTGFRTVIQRFTDSRHTIVILANRTDRDVEALSLKVAGLL